MVEGNPHIYLVDDDAAVRKALHRLLVSAGYSVDTFASGENFLDSIPLDSEGLIVLDIFMPEMDGFMLQNKLRGLRSKLGIIFISGFANAQDRERAMASGAKGFLQKPFSEESLLKLLDEAKVK
jgi:two-component system, LuxR family, response regulator FixJ